MARDVWALRPPTWHTRPAGIVESDGDLVASVCETAGFAPDPEQRLLLNDSFAVDARGRLAAFEVATIAPRQNIKTGFLKQACLGWLYVTPVRLIVWSAHAFDTAQEAFRDMDELCASHPSLASRVKKVHRGNGDEAIEMKSGARLKFKARTKSGGRGLSGDRVILDEAFALEASHMGALMPTLSARPDPQIHYASSAGQVKSLILRDVRDRGRKGDPRLAYAEWGDAGTPCAREDCDHARDTLGCALDDRDLWYRYNTALGRRITEEYVAAERRALPPEEFARERFGIWDEPAESGVELTPAAWSGVLDAELDVREVPEIVLAIDVAPGHARASIVAVGFDPARGVPVGELVESRAGSSWLAERVASLAGDYGAAVALNSTGPVGSLVPALIEAGVDDHIDVRGSDYTKACGLLVAHVEQRAVRQHGDPELAAAVMGARARKSGDGFIWSRSDSTVDISPLVAFTVGHWAVVAELSRPLSDDELLSSAF